MVLFEKFSQHRPLNRQAERYAREGMPISLSTLADQVGGCTAALAPLFKRLEAHVLSAERLHGDDTRVPVLAKGKTDTGRMWVYVRDDKPFGGSEPPGAVFYYSRDRAGEHPQAHLAGYSGINTADISARSLNRNVKPIAAANKDAASGRQTAVITSVALMPRGRGARSNLPYR